MRAERGLAAFAIIFLALSACSQNDGSSGEGAEPSPTPSSAPSASPVPTPAPPGIKQGQIHDSPIAGLSYRTPSMFGTTGAQGEFDYRDGERVAFLIGDIEIGETTGSALITLTRLVHGDASNRSLTPRVVNLARLLQTLDSDAEPRNGIVLAPQSLAAAAGQDINFSVAPDLFAQDPGLVAFLEASAQRGGPAIDDLVSATAASSHLNQELDVIEQRGTPNLRPRANASVPEAATSGTRVDLSGVGEDDDGSIVSYAWEQRGGSAVSIDGADSATATFIAPVVDESADISLRFTVIDNENALDYQNLRVRIDPVAGPSNTAPVVEDAQITLDEDSVAQGQLLAEDAEGDEIVFERVSDPVHGQLDLAADGAFRYTPLPNYFGADSFVVRASDGRLTSADATVGITVTAVNDAPVAYAGPGQVVVAMAEVTLDGSGSRDVDDGVASYAWTQTSGPDVSLQNADQAVAGFTAPDTTESVELVFALRVTDPSGAESVDTTVVTVTPEGQPQPPVAHAGDDQVVDEGQSVTLDGSASTDAEGPIAAYAWTQLSGPDVELQGADSEQATFDAPDVSQDTELEFELEVTDADDNTASDTVTIQVRALLTPPVAEAGDDQTVLETATVTLNAANSDDPDGTLVGYQWEQISGVPVSLENADSAIAQFVAPEVDASGATLRFELTVTDNDGLSNTDRVAVFVRNLELNVFRVGTARAVVSPSQAHIDGVVEARIGEADHLQKFNLGGFGIDPTQNFPDPIGGFGNELTAPAAATAHVNDKGEREETWVRVMALSLAGDDRVDQTIIFVTLDAVGAGNIIQADLTAAIAESTGVSASNVVFGQTHTHAGADLQGLWGGVPQDWIKTVLYPQAVDAAQRALATREAVTLSVSHRLDSNYNNYRRPRQDTDADADPRVSLLRAEAVSGGRIVGHILQYAAHPTSVNEDPRAPHADYILGAVDYLEELGGTALYYNGPIADASGSGSRPGCVSTDGKYGSVRCRGEGIAESGALSREEEGAATTLAPSLNLRQEEVILPVTNPLFVGAGLLGAFNRYYDFAELPTGEVPLIGPVLAEQALNLPQATPTARTLVSRISIGGEQGLDIVTMPGEAPNTLGEYLRGLSPAAEVMLFGLTHNSFGYLLPEEEFNYIDTAGDDGFTLPFTGYEEFVSLGPMTVPLLKLQGYHPLFDVGPEGNMPAYLAACNPDPTAEACILNIQARRLDYTQRGLAAQCRDNEGPEEFCGLLDPDTPLRPVCDGLGLPEDTCAAFGDVDDGGEDDADPADLLEQGLQASLRGCDPLDAAHCLYPFPSDQFVVEAPSGIQSIARGGTGKRINFNPLAMPRNSAGKPIDATEWNRNDGFSPGQLIITYVDGLDLEQTYGLPADQLGVTNPALSTQPEAPIFVLELDADGAAVGHHPVFVEMDANANLLVRDDSHQRYEKPGYQGKSALLIRPARNFKEGTRYVVVLRNLRNASGELIPAGPVFDACRAGQTTTIPGIDDRCAALAANVFPAISDEVALDEVYLSWDFTVASTMNNIGRLRHMRDVAGYGDSCDDDDVCTTPQFTIDEVLNPGEGDIEEGMLRQIRGTLTVPSFIAPADTRPLDDPQIQQVISEIQAQFPDEASDLFEAAGIAQGGSLPPNRLYFDPADGDDSFDVFTSGDYSGARFGDGLPDTLGTMNVPFICTIPAQATSSNPARAGIYGHGLLDQRGAIRYDGVDALSREYNYLFCAVDLFGFSQGDIPNVASTLIELSSFGVVPDASQQGLLNYVALARALRSDQGFLTHPAFQDDNRRPLYDSREIFYDGNSQGGIVGGAVLAVSKDLKRGILGSLGMNYSTLLRRSVDFDLYSIPLYLSYTDELDRNVLFSLMQMLWDRSENNGYAHHIVDNSAFGGPSNVAKLDPQFGDHQVTPWSADVMARTMGIPWDGSINERARVELGQEKRHPDVSPGWGMNTLDYDNAEQVRGSALVLFDMDRNGAFADIPPIDNVPPQTGVDPHDNDAKDVRGRCHKAHFLRTDGKLVDTRDVLFDGADCPSVPPVDPAPFVDTDGDGVPDVSDACPNTPPGSEVDAQGCAIVDEETGLPISTADFEAAVARLQEGDFAGASDAVLAGLQQNTASALQAVMVAVGQEAGVALPMPGEKPAASSQPVENLRAGVAKAAIQVPVGTPLGGYLRPPIGGEYIPGAEAFAAGDPNVFFDELVDFIPAMADGCDEGHPESCPPLAPLPDELRAIHSPYATYSPPSRGYYDSLVAKAVALYDGADYVVLVKTDFIGMLNELVEDVKAKVRDQTGVELGDGLILSATHTHDGPGAMANNSTRYFWLAMDVYQPDVYRRVVAQLAEVVVAALDDMQPAVIGHGSGADTLGLNGYRRGKLPSYDDARRDALRQRIGVLRVNAASTNEPLALIINWAAHGIAFDVENQFFSGDVLASVERETEQLMGVPLAMLVQSASGDVSPRNNLHDNKLQRIEAYGKRLAPQVAAIAQGISNYQSAPDLRAVTQRVILDRAHLEYAPGEYPYPWGGGQCGNDVAVPFAGYGVSDIPGYDMTGLPEKIPFCLPSTPPDAVDLADNGVAENGAFYPQDAIVTAAMIGDIVLLGQPGEPLVEYGVRLLDRAEALGFAPVDTFIWGYTGDHIGYILPPEKEDWATLGGAESTTTFWGWKQGERFLNVTTDLLRALLDGTPAPRDEFTADYSLYGDLYAGVPGPTPTVGLFAGAALVQPASIPRFESTVFVFEGGDPVIDTPQVRMERLPDSGEWKPVRRANGEILDTFFEMHLEYRLVSGRHLWSVIFEAPRDWPVDEYRFVVSGQAVSPAAGETEPYELESDAFAVGAARLQVEPRSPALFELAYPARPNNYRVVDPQVGSEHAAPVREVSLIIADYPDGRRVLVINPGVDLEEGSDSNPPVAVVEFTGPTDYTQIRFEDEWGNFQTWSASDNTPVADRGAGLLGVIADAGAESHAALTALLDSNPDTAAEHMQQAAEDVATALAEGPTTVDPERPGETLIGLDGEPDEVAIAALSRARDAAPVVISGAQLTGWSVPPAHGVGYPYPSGATISGALLDDSIAPGQVRDAHNGVILYPAAGLPVGSQVPVETIAAYRWESGNWVEIPVQVDEKAPYFLANANSDFSVYSGTDPEITYVWDNGDAAHTYGDESWMMVGGQCDRAYPEGLAPVPDPVPGLDDDDEIVFMYSDAGEINSSPGSMPPGATAMQMLTVVDPLLQDTGLPSSPRAVYLVQQEGGSSFSANHYVRYERDANADQWIDRRFFDDADPEKLGTSNTGYGANLVGTVCPDGTPQTARASTDRFPRDGVTVSTDNYQWQASGRWMVRSVKIRKPGDEDVGDGYWSGRPDLVDRWKGRAFQQSPDSTISLVGFEDEQVNWEGNASLLGERCGPVRCIRETWGADSGTNVTKTETFYRDAVSYQYRVRVHPIPADGLYTSWDYNRSAMVPGDSDPEGTEPGRYFTMLRPQGVPIDGINDDLGNVDGYAPVLAGQCMGSDGPTTAAGNGRCPAFFDTADPTFNLPLAFNNWEQVSGKGDSGSLVYSFELVGLTSLANPLVVPYYRDDACLDDGTGDDPVSRFWPGESYDWGGGRVRQSYDAAAGRPLDYSGTVFADCLQRQGAHGSHGVHYFVTHDSDNAFTPTTSTEIDARQWQYMVPSSTPRNVGEPYANNIRVPLRVSVLPMSLPIPSGKR